MNLFTAIMLITTIVNLLLKLAVPRALIIFGLMAHEKTAPIVTSALDKFMKFLRSL